MVISLDHVHTIKPLQCVWFHWNFELAYKVLANICGFWMVPELFHVNCFIRRVMIWAWKTAIAWLWSKMKVLKIMKFKIFLGYSMNIWYIWWILCEFSISIFINLIHKNTLLLHMVLVLRRKRSLKYYIVILYFSKKYIYLVQIELELL